MGLREVMVLAFASALIAMGCGPSIVGRECSSTDPCPTHFGCAPAHDGVMRCMRECSLSETVCSDDTVCLPLGASSLGGLCYLGGNVAVGSSCSSDLDCTRTAICIRSGTITECRVGCNVDGTHGCAGGFFCQPTTGSAGFCGQTM